MPAADILHDSSERRRAELAHFIGGENDYDRLIACARELGKSMAGNNLTNSQLRNIYGIVKQMQVEGFDQANARKLKLLRPKLAYLSAREPALRTLAAVLDDAIQMVGDKAPLFERFADFFEAIVAYHYAAAASGKGPRR